mmetsp:Transcript_39923/g.105948  ORF Transcript_39923/g.105948 Transcript_39923/m.105948 type:complete len:288 (+) Transcript_39923:526-1389(+)
MILLRLDQSTTPSGGGFHLGHIQPLLLSLVLQMVYFQPKIVDLSYESDILLQYPHVVLAVHLGVLKQFPLQTLHRLLKVFPLAVVLELDVGIKFLLFDTVRHVLFIEIVHVLAKRLWLLNVLDAFVQVVLEPLDDGLTVGHSLSLLHDVLLQCSLLTLQLFDVDLELLVFLVVILQVRVHRLDLFLHFCNVVIFGVDLCLELLDFVVKNKLKLFELLVLLLQIVNSAFLLTYSPVALPYLTVIVRLILCKLIDPFLLLPSLILILTELLLLFQHLLFEFLMIPFADP